jgi:hypothetical protein
MRVGTPFRLPRAGREVALSVGEMVPTVAKKKPKLDKTWTSKPVAFQVRGSLDYKAVLEELALFDGKSIASLADHAIRLYARSIGFTKTLPKR